MAFTRLQFRDEARAKVLAGASELADAVRVTLGPRSKSVLIALENAVSVAGVLLLAEATLTEIEEAPRERSALEE